MLAILQEKKRVILLLVPLMVAAAPVSGRDEAPTIVVTAKRTDTELADCLARKCGVREDAIASIHHAQAQFAQGAYPDARKTLLASLARNRGATEHDPRALSALWYALARVTLHNGDLQEYRRAALRSGSILAGSEAVTPIERISGQVQIGDALAMAGDSNGAVRRYRMVEDAARERGDIELAQMMELRAIYARASLHGRPTARRALERAVEEKNLTPQARVVALALAAQLQERPDNRVAELLDDVPVQSADAPPMLIWAPKDRHTEQREVIARALANNDTLLFNMLQPRNGEMKRYSWADIGFWIRPDGRVEEVEVLRGSNNQEWTKDVLRVVGGRRYAPFVAKPGDEGRYKIERVTLTFEHQTPAGSLIRRRSGLPSFQFEELEVQPAIDS